MCGITGWVNWHQDLTTQAFIVEKMTQTLAKRGPDASNIWSSRHVSFGHTRLIVVDPAGGIQPMKKTVNKHHYTIVYNGELYNTEELRQELVKAGHAFRSHSDTEVLLTAYIEWGEKCVDHLNGIFAFAVWDENKERLFMARDRVGVKPLFYKEGGGSLVFGSELKAILSHPAVKSEIGREGLQEVFGLGPSHTPGHGIFRGIKELRPAHALSYCRNGLKIWRYWNVVSKEHNQSLKETAEQVRFLMEDAVRRQLTADVPVCTFLSGGVDSSAISQFAADFFREEGHGPLHTYSIDYIHNRQYFQSSTFQPDEDRPWIEKIQQHLGTVHHAAVIQNDQLADYLTDAVKVRDLPGMADVDSSLLWFCEQIKPNFTVALSGECADEIFGGYPWFYREELLNDDSFPWMKSQEERQRLLLPHWQKRLDLKRYVRDRYEETVQETPRLDGESPLEARRREMFYLNMTWFMTTLLERKDRMSMGASLEVRVPFADHRLVEYAWNIPWDMKMLNGREKGVLRLALEGVLPHDVLYRKKSPYPKTYHPEYTARVTKQLTDIINKPCSPILEILSKTKVADIIDSNGSSFKAPWFGQLMTGPQLIAHLVQINGWLEHYNINIVDN
ncbi:asparagine synthase (glutamine-hydrolyzing) [Pseudobacillus badius]|uniref:asparagine synthase (glutamine-hydrolyzing) n=1 Tax=Bacillus badius TaxID=1455 RepID=UPI0007B0BA80|nr:asparagine synthase (glutamine-hydrolyzing) [Bacillus badius]KZO00741.1 asparagine synthetase B [Bacillus badius]OCS88154.1 asparagine synthase (glutamine-hydrolyzing) [Bacillus badius]OVE53319.1 asparagine synthase (glutamine-hydrolyzing) [Bacillus badius]TDW05663.1 asparagine synthase (glutamine-hydrolysing) [Bacillus badius]